MKHKLVGLLVVVEWDCLENSLLWFLQVAYIIMLISAIFVIVTVPEVELTLIMIWPFIIYFSMLRKIDLM